MGAYQDAEFPWLVAEKTAIARAARGGVPFWGVCLGAQLLAAALGADVYPGPVPEVGIGWVRTAPTAADDVVFRDLPAEFPTLQWHSDSFALPDGALLLASSDTYPHQAFAVGRAYGVQFHLEVTPKLVAEWAEVPAYAASLEAVSGPAAVNRLLAEVTAHAAHTAAIATPLFTRWLDHVVEPALLEGLTA